MIELLKKEMDEQFSGLSITDDAERQFHIQQVEKYINRAYDLGQISGIGGERVRCEEIARKAKVIGVNTEVVDITEIIANAIEKGENI